MNDEESPEAPRIISAVGIALGAATVSAVAAVRHNFALQHLLAAARFSRHVGDVERENLGKPFGDFFEEMIAYSSACVLSTVAGLEAYINELFADRDKYLRGSPPRIVDKLWDLAEQRPILDKYDIALTVLGRDTVKRGEAPAQNVDILIRLRNAITHFKPEWDNEQTSHASLSTRLKGRFSGNSYFSNQGMFPVRWISHGATQWAVTSAIAFIEDFEKSANIEQRWSRSDARLQS